MSIGKGVVKSKSVFVVKLLLGYHDSKNGAQVPALQVGGHASSMAIAGWPRSAVLRSRKKEETAMCDARAMFIDDMLLCSSIGKAIIRDAENIWKPRAVQSGRCLFLVALEQQLVSCPCSQKSVNMETGGVPRLPADTSKSFCWAQKWV